MKRNPTRKEKKLLNKRRLNPDNWLIRKIDQDGMHLENKNTGARRVLPASLMK